MPSSFERSASGRDTGCGRIGITHTWARRRDLIDQANRSETRSAISPEGILGGVKDQPVAVPQTQVIEQRGVETAGEPDILNAAPVSRVNPVARLHSGPAHLRRGVQEDGKIERRKGAGGPERQDGGQVWAARQPNRHRPVYIALLDQNRATGAGRVDAYQRGVQGETAEQVCGGDAARLGLMRKREALEPALQGVVLGEHPAVTHGRHAAYGELAKPGRRPRWSYRTGPNRQRGYAPNSSSSVIPDPGQAATYRRPADSTATDDASAAYLLRGADLQESRRAPPKRCQNPEGERKKQ